MKIYVLEGGFDYEGVTVLGVYSTKEKANAVNEFITGYDYTEIEELELDQFKDTKKQSALEVFLREASST